MVTFPRTCQCGKTVKESEARPVIQCRRDPPHFFVCCSDSCRRLLEKSCKKVADYLTKAKKKLNNDGHTSALRRMPPGERDKFKQHQEAEQQGLRLCPEEIRSAERSVAYCAWILDWPLVAEDAEEDSKPQAAPPPAPERAAAPMELLEDDQLVPLRREEEEDEGVARKKPQKRKERKGLAQVLSPADWYEQRQGDEAAPERTTPTGAPPQPQLLDHQKYSPPGYFGPVMGGVTEQAEPMDTAVRIENLQQLAGCSELRARDALEQSAWNTERAADLIFASEEDAAPRWGPRKQAQKSADPAGQADAAPSPAAAKAAEPAAPPGWVPVWSEEHQAYYYWHTPTGDVTWDDPAGTVDATLDDDTELQRQEALVSQASDITGLEATPMRRLLEANGWNLELAIRAHVREEEERPPGQPQGGGAGGGGQDRQHRAAAAAEAPKARPADPGCHEAVGAAQAAVAPGLYVCTRHWRPRSEVAECMAITWGEYVEVLWSDGNLEGWAYGKTLQEPEKEAYFPQEILQPRQRRPPPRQLGDRCKVVEHFEAPPEVGGYLSVSPGDVLQFLHTAESPYVWIYAQRVASSQGPTPVATGWVPSSVLEGG